MLVSAIGVQFVATRDDGPLVLTAHPFTRDQTVEYTLHDGACQPWCKADFLPETWTLTRQRKAPSGPGCRCGLDEHPNGPRFAIMCPKHDGVIQP